MISRTSIDELIERGNYIAARTDLSRFWRQSPTPAVASFVVSRFEKLRGNIPMVESKVTLLRSFTVEPVVPLLRATGFIGGLDLNVQIGDFNGYAQEMLEPGSRLYAFSPDIVILAVQTDDVAPALWGGFADLKPAAVEGIVQQTIATFRLLLATFRRKSKAQLLIHTLQLPPNRANGVLDAQSRSGQAGAIERVNQALLQLAQDYNNVYLLDTNALVARRGWDRWFDARKHVSVGMPIVAQELIHLAREWVRYLHPMAGKVCKVLAVDLDNTLWGGIIGEDGIDGIKLNNGFPGIAYRSLQRAMLDLYQRGILLAVCSKNNLPDALEAIEKHPDMLLRRDHFAALRINWQDKASNLRALAAELNLGIDAIAFMDDNPVEREWVRAQVPEVTIIDLPEDPMDYAQALRQSPVFERLKLSEEDHSRGRYYAEDRMRAELLRSSNSVEHFYRFLQIVVHIEPVTKQSLARAAELTQKTNQFNVTTQRYTEAQIAAMAPPLWRTYTMRVQDRYGDNGIVGLALVKMGNGTCEIDTFLLSCRVIGRTVETTLLATIAEDAVRAGSEKIVGRFLPTKKNASVKDFYRQHGFVCVADENGTQLWELSLELNTLSGPSWIERHVRSSYSDMTGDHPRILLPKKSSAQGAVA
ncbi:MAG: HAD-IIIC family phosphatase [Gammaproteobacteria bacterium]